MSRSPLYDRTVSLHRRLQRELKRARRGDVDGVHQARVATRRLREAVGALRPLLPRRAHRNARRALRRITRALGPVRELDVTRGRVARSAVELGWSRAATARLDAYLAGLRRAAFAECARVLDETLSTRTRHGLPEAVKVLEQTVGIGELREAAVARRRRRARRLAQGLAGLGRLYVPDYLHRVRIAVKQLRYALEWEAAFGPRTWTRERRRLEDVQDLLGEWHDLVVLQLYLDRAVQALAPGALPGAPMMSAAIERQCRQLHARVLAGVGALTTVAGRAGR